LPFLSWATAGSANFVLGYDFSAPYGCFGDALVLNIYKDAAGTTLVYSTAYAGAASIGTGGNTEVIPGSKVVNFGATAFQYFYNAYFSISMSANDITNGNYADCAGETAYVNFLVICGIGWCHQHRADS
jgi:hypothetical protein